MYVPGRPDITTILFDVDDTLFDRRRSQEYILDLIVEGYRELFDPIDRAAVGDALRRSDVIVSSRMDAGLTFPDGPRVERSRVFLEQLGLDQSRAGDVNALYMDVYPRAVFAIEGAVEVVRGLSRTRKLGVVSNGFVDIQSEKIRALGIADFFSCVVLSDAIGIRKPDSRIFLHAAHILGKEPAQCLYVGDSFLHDVVGAAGANMRTCWFNPDAKSPPQEESRDLRPDVEITGLRELPTWFDQSM
jgi:HAD superfamily hydrolase (TIGR01509 family)